jgi:hypothetical protein
VEPAWRLRWIRVGHQRQVEALVIGQEKQPSLGIACLHPHPKPAFVKSSGFAQILDVKMKMVEVHSGVSIFNQLPSSHLPMAQTALPGGGAQRQTGPTQPKSHAEPSPCALPAKRSSKSRSGGFLSSSR